MNRASSELSIETRHAVKRACGVSTGLAAVAILLLAGCSSGASVTVNVSVPRPLVQTIDASVGVYFDDELVNYVHEEELQDHGSFRIDIGASQTPVFAQVFDAMFDRVVSVSREGAGASTASTGAERESTDQNDESGDAGAADENSPADDEGERESGPVRFTVADGRTTAIDGIIAPSIQEVQFAIPDQTGGEFYEVWIRYKLDLYDPAGNLLGELPLIGFGKANEANFGSLGQTTPALNQATIWALRDAAALLSFQFRDQPEAQAWLAMIYSRQMAAKP